MSKYGMTLTVLCTELAEAVNKDEQPEAGGCDVSAGMFGPHLSEWLRKLAEQLTNENRPVAKVQLPYCAPFDETYDS